MELQKLIIKGASHPLPQRSRPRRSCLHT